MIYLFVWTFTHTHGYDGIIGVKSQKFWFCISSGTTWRKERLAKKTFRELCLALATVRMEAWKAGNLSQVPNWLRLRLPPLSPTQSHGLYLLFNMWLTAGQCSINDYFRCSETYSSLMEPSPPPPPKVVKYRINICHFPLIWISSTTTNLIL